MVETINPVSESYDWQDSIIVGCVPPSCQPYVFQWPPQDVSIPEEGGVSPEVNEFEHVSDYQQMSVTGVGPKIWCLRGVTCKLPPLSDVNRRMTENITFRSLVCGQLK